MKLPILYKRSTTGKISTWYIETEGNKFRTVSGFTDGLKITSEWTVCEAKNVGKKNGTTPEEQAVAQAKAMHQKKIDLGAFENINDIDKPVHFKPMLARELSEVEITYPVMVQPKYDGIRCATDISLMQSRNGKEIISAPHISESLIPVFEKYPDLILDGELFSERSEEMDFNKIISCVRKTKPTADDLAESKKHIKYYVYDCPSAEGGFEQRYEYLKTLDLPDTIVIVPTGWAKSLDEVKKWFSKYIEAGYEGLMIRRHYGLYENKRSKNLIKYKEFITEEYTIQGVEEGQGKLTGRVGRLIFETTSGKTFSSAVNGDHDYLAELFKAKNLIGKPATVRFQELTPDGVPRFPKVIAIRDYE